MIVNLSVLAFAATLLSSKSLVLALSSSDIPPDTPISSLLASANAHLAKGETNDALTYYDVAISRDPQNYLTYFKRGATYLSLGRTAQATQDFDKVLTIKPGFEGALLQRAKIRAKNGEWDAAKEDYLVQGGSTEELAELEEARGAATLALDAEKKYNWEECVAQSGVAIMVASKMLPLRKTRAHCRFERGEVQEGMSDLKHVLQMQPGMTEPHMQISGITFYALADLEHGIDQLRKCLHSDPDSKSCKKLYRREKTLDKELAQAKKFIEKNQYASAIKMLLPSGEDLGLVQEIKDDVKELREAGTIPKQSPNDLVTRVVEMVCEGYHEVCGLSTIQIRSHLTLLDEKLPKGCPVLRRSSDFQ
jgi:DnaJ family protein C protein 3